MVERTDNLIDQAHLTSHSRNHRRRKCMMFFIAFCLSTLIFVSLAISYHLLAPHRLKFDPGIRRRLEEKQHDSDDKKEERDGHGLDFDDQIYIDDDYVDDYYAFEEDKDGRPHLLPIETRDIAGFLLASMGVTLAAGGGIGGGGLVVPIYILVMGLSPGDAIPISSVTVFGGALASFLVNFPKRHPLADRPLIDWNLVLVMEPLVLTGALVGTMLHRLLSEKVLVVMLVVLLSGMAHTTLSKARRMFRAETLYIDRLKKFHEHLQSMKHPYSSPEPVPVIPPLTLEPSTDTNDHTLLSSVYPLPATQNSGQTSIGAKTRQEILILNPDFVSLRSELLQQEKFTPRNKIIALCSMFSVLIFLNIMVGGGAFQSPWGIVCGSVAFWVVQIIMGAFLIASAWAAQTYLVNRHYMKDLVRLDYVHGDIRWDSRGAILYPLLFVTAGLFAGLFGIGGGMICVPLLLAMGVHPIVATATSSCMILFTSFSAVTSYAIFDLILRDFAVVCLFIGFFATLLGQLLMQRARNAGHIYGQNFERNSIIAFAIGGVVLLSALLMTVQYVLSIIKFDGRREMGGICEGYGRGTV